MFPPLRSMINSLQFWYKNSYIHISSKSLCIYNVYIQNLYNTESDFQKELNTCRRNSLDVITVFQVRDDDGLEFIDGDDGRRKRDSRNKIW